MQQWCNDHWLLTFIIIMFGIFWVPLTMVDITANLVRGVAAIFKRQTIEVKKEQS